jgi:hypothetical protein
VEQKHLFAKLKFLKETMDAFFRESPSAKFAYTGRLEPGDKTENGFYVIKNDITPRTRFPVIGELSEPGTVEAEIYVSCFNDDRDLETSNSQGKRYNKANFISLTLYISH